MNLGASAIVLRPRTTTEVLDLACRFAAGLALGLYARLAAIVLLPCFALALALRYVWAWDWPWVWAAAIALATPAQGVFTMAASRLLFSEALSARLTLRLFGRRLGAYLGALFFRALILGAACVPFFLAVPTAWTRVLFQHEASLLEGAGPSEAIRRAGRFVAGRGGDTFGALLALLAAQGVILVGVEVLGQGLLDGVLQLGHPFGTLQGDGGSPAALLGFFLSIPFAATARFLQYIDARTRADGWDIQLRFMAIAARDEAERKAV